MLNRKITEQTPMAEILAKVRPEMIEGIESENERFKQAQALIKDLYDMQNEYRAGIKEVSTKLEILNEEFQTTYERNPIHNMKSRVKSPKSIVEKLSRKGFPLTIHSAKNNLDDIAGIRIICPYIEDIYTIKTLLEAQDDVEFIRVTDYIANPKPNGYRSLHLIIRVPVFFSNYKAFIKVEVQIRTIAMDFWASLEHQLRYKAIQIDNIPEAISRELKECADTIAETDMKMQNIHNQMMI